ncbi:MAG: S8 family serine peptidase, partial [Rhodobacteraceae bacterium]|nr:S8 family serine peptidase [Paracoccaceae bacterium]
MSRKRIERRKTNNSTTPLKLMANADSLLFLITSLLLILLFSSNPALSQTITASEYREGVSWREDNVKSALTDYEGAQADLEDLDRDIKAREAELAKAETAFREAERDGDSDSMFDAYSEIGSISIDLIFLREKHEIASTHHEDSQGAWQREEIWLEQYKNDYEAQSDPFFIRDNIARCARTRCSPGSFLRDTRFTTFQPVVLEMVGVHHAYALGLTGDGVRIGIEDDIVNFTLPEFAERISYEGATLTYPVPYGDNLFSEARRCQREEVSAPDCVVLKNLTFEERFEKNTVRWWVNSFGWPQEGQNWFLHDDTLPEGDFRRWVKIPYGSTDNHGTAVASVAAGRDFGVAPGATIIPIAKDFSADGQFDQRSAETSLLRFIANLSAQDRRFIDAELAEEIKADYEHFDVINRSFGIGVFDPISINAVLNDPTQWWGEQFRSILPETWRAFMQTGRHPDERTVVVYATGNSTEEFGGLGSQLPYHETHVRGHQLAVMALDHTGSHADYTNFCGPLPGNWDATRWGRHFCLAAPGMVNTAGSGGPGFISHEVQGTSFAAPVVTGAIALLMERFRGQLGNTEIVKRLVNTANNTGRYAQLEIYGAGLLDLEAALRPVGEVRTGTQNLLSQSAATAIMVPTAFGNLGKKLSGKGIEVASVDALGAPFWSSPEQFITTAWDDPWGTGSVFSAFGNQYLQLNGGPWSSNALMQHHFMQPPGLSGFGALE